ncbi:TlpA disulfide reductase family protein [Sphingobacterium sp.]|uniref:TlpA family protein disulfide reductase n=1 Tax=Sphingobacterium sp. TaxID=341027 RepID=UPI0031DB45E4
MMKHLFFIVFLAILGMTAGAQVKFKVTGKVIGDLQGCDKIYFYNQQSRDSSRIVNGRFDCELNTNGIELKFFYLEYAAKVRGMFTPMPLLIDRSGEIKLTMELIPADIKVEMGGEPTAVKVFKFQQQMQGVYVQTQQQLIKFYPKEAFKESHPQFEGVKKMRRQILESRLDSLLQIYLNGQDPVAEAYILLSQANGLSLDRLLKTYLNLSREAKNTDFGKTVFAKLEGLKQEVTKAGVPDFELKDALGRSHSMQVFRGKYVLVDFWASWCVPCRASFPRIREIYQKLLGKPIEFVNISIDQNYKAWLKAVAEEQNPWLQLYDDKKIGYSHFSVQALPTTFLLDPEGKIILKEIGFESKGGGLIEKKLAEIFNMEF